MLMIHENINKLLFIKLINVIMLNIVLHIKIYLGAFIMAINNGDFVRLNFTGKIKENDEIFDTTLKM